MLLDRDATLTRRLSPYLHAVVVRDLGGFAEATVSRGDARGWRRSDDELFALAKRNAVAADVAGVVLQTASTAAGDFELAVSNGFYLNACVLEMLERADAQEGILVCFATWHHAALHTVGATTSSATLVAMRELVAAIAAEARVRTSEWLGTEIHLWRDGALEPLRFDGEAPDAPLRAPEALVARLGGDAGA